jgi:hypothetical protein
MASRVVSPPESAKLPSAENAMYWTLTTTMPNSAKRRR